MLPCAWRHHTAMESIDAHATIGRSDGGEKMTPRSGDMDAAIWQRIDDVGYAHHIAVWMIILELEGEGVYPINNPAIHRRMFQWWGEYQKEDRVDTSVQRLHEHGFIERNEVEEGRGGKHNTTAPTGIEIARQLALKWLQLLDCEDRQDLHEIDPEASASGENDE